jgi:hypothetical protein
VVEAAKLMMTAQKMSPLSWSLCGVNMRWKHRQQMNASAARVCPPACSLNAVCAMVDATSMNRASKWLSLFQINVAGKAQGGMREEADTVRKIDSNNYNTTAQPHYTCCSKARRLNQSARQWAALLACHVGPQPCNGDIVFHSNRCRRRLLLRNNPAARVRWLSPKGRPHACPQQADAVCWRSATSDGSALKGGYTLIHSSPTVSAGYRHPRAAVSCPHLRAGWASPAPVSTMLMAVHAVELIVRSARIEQLLLLQSNSRLHAASYSSCCAP